MSNSSHIKALVLCGGKGTRLRPVTSTLPKHLLPIANRPILFYVLDHISKAGITQVGIVISPGVGDEICSAVGNGSQWGIAVDYILQLQAGGLAHAVSCARDFLRDSPFLLFLGDNFIQGGVAPFVEEFISQRPDALILLKEVADPRAFGVAQLDDQGQVVKLVEKPRKPLSNLALVGAYILSPAIHRAIDGLKPSRRGELEITDAIQRLIDMGGQVHSHILQGWWLDTGNRDDLLLANRVALDEFLCGQIAGTVGNTSVCHTVDVGPNTHIENSQLQGPVSIAGDCTIRNSVIGPYVSVGTGTLIEDAQLRDSIVLEGCHIHGIGPITNSIISRNCRIIRASPKEGVSLFMGEHTELAITGQ
ncbi:MAG: glucose-1-phosphate thymidylyltransferase [Dehalococcoidia bacterium]